MILYVLFEIIKINIFRKDSDASLAGLISMLLLGFAFYLSIKYGLGFDYGTDDEITMIHAELMSNFAIANAITGLVFIVIWMFKFLIWGIKQLRNKE